MNHPFSRLLPTGSRTPPAHSRRGPCRQPGADLSEPVTLAAAGPSPPLLASRRTQLTPNTNGTPGPPITPPRGRPADASRPRIGTGTPLGTKRLAVRGPGVGAGVRPGGSVGVGLDTDPHTDPAVHLSVQVSRYRRLASCAATDPCLGSPPGVMRNPYQH